MKEKIKNPLCKNCKNFRQTSENEFVCGKYNLTLKPLSRTEVNFGCWEEAIKNNEILNLKPSFYGISLDLKKLWAIIKEKIRNFY